MITTTTALSRAGPLCRYCEHGEHIHGSANMTCTRTYQFCQLQQVGVTTRITNTEKPRERQITEPLPWFDWPRDYNAGFVTECKSFRDRGVPGDTEVWDRWWLGARQFKEATAKAVAPKRAKYWRGFCCVCDGGVRLYAPPVKGQILVCRWCREKIAGEKGKNA